MQFTSKKYQMFLYAQAALIALSICGCSSSDSNTFEGEIPAPGHAYKAVVFRRTKSALMGVTENISIVRYGEPLLNEPGNVYSAAVDANGNAPKVWINWRGTQALQIFRDPKAHTYKEEKKVSVLTGIFIQTADFQIEFGDYNDIRPAAKSEAKASGKRRQAGHGKHS
jgi:hypothetical protein